jgi:hypothetical protein
MTVNTKNYIEPGEFYDEMVKCLISGVVTERLGWMFYKLADKNANHRYFVRYFHIRDELISAGVLTCVEKFRKFKPLRDGEWDGVTHVPYHYLTCNNPFAYYTRCIHNAFKQYLKEHEYKNRNIVNKFRVSHGLEPDDGYKDMMRNDDEDPMQSGGFDDDCGHVTPNDIDDYMNSMLASDFEIGGNSDDTDQSRGIQW